MEWHCHINENANWQSANKLKLHQERIRFFTQHQTEHATKPTAVARNATKQCCTYKDFNVKTGVNLPATKCAATMDTTSVYSI